MLHLKKVAGGVAASGDFSCAFGRKLPDSSAGHPDGVFLEWTWDGRRLLLRNDRYGFFPVYYFAGPREICISTSIPQLVAAGAPTELDGPGLAVFLRLGFFIGEDTPFRHVRALPPGAILDWEGGAVRVSERGSPVTCRSISRDEAIDTYIALFRNAIHRRLPSDQNFAVPLSGGRDSRHILLELCAAGCRPRFCITVHRFPPDDIEDAEVAKRMAQALGLAHVVLPCPGSRLRAELEKNIETSFCADEHAWYLPLANYLRKEADIVYDGIAGDVLSAGLFLEAEPLTLFEQGRFERLSDYLFRTPEWCLRRLLTPRQYRRWSRAVATDHLIDELRKHANAPNPVGSFYFWNRTRREIALVPYAMYRGVDQVLSPYLDHELYDFLAALPARMLLDHSFHTDAIRRAHPRYADIPFATKASPPMAHRTHFRRFGLEFSLYAMWRLRSQIVRPGFLMPRLLRRCMKGDLYVVNTLYILALYLLQLEETCAKARCGQGAGRIVRGQPWTARVDPA